MATESAFTASTTRGEWRPSDWVLRLRDDHDSSRPALGAERALHYTSFYRSPESDCPAPVRKARALAWHLRRRTLKVHPGEVLVGSHTEHRIGALCHVELGGCAMLEDVFRFDKRRTNPLYVDPSARRELVRRVIPYWLNRNLAMRAFPWWRRPAYAADQLRARRFVIHEAGGVAHFLPDYAGLIEMGTEGLRTRLQARRREPDLTPAQTDHLRAALIVLSALENLADRYRRLALKQGRKDIAELLARAPRYPATTLHEALQTIWLFHMTIQIESLDQGISLGRVDQYLYPLYLREKARGDFDEGRCKDLFCAFCLKLSEIVPLFSARATEMYAGWPSGQALTLGGLDEFGEDAANELTLMLLDVVDKFKTRQPNWHARCSERSGAAYLARVHEVVARGGGSPALYNDEAIISAMARRHDAPDRLWNYATVGCVEPALPGESYTSSDAAIFNLAAVLENVLRRRGPALYRIRDMDGLLATFDKELERRIEHLARWLDRIEETNRREHPVPLASLTVRHCIERARDLTDGGAEHNASGIQGIGVADVANSLAAIEEVVFERKEVSLPKLARICRRDFKGHERLRQRLLGAPKFGNDHPGVDAYARRVTALFDRAVSARRNTRGGRWMPGFYSMTCHRSMGRRMGALPSGRRRGEALADGLAPTDGSDRLGPTASLNSVASLDHGAFGNGINLNIKFDARTLRGERGAGLLRALIGGYFRQGGMQVQVNVLDPEVLLEARENPEKHRNLMVRISGYSARFVDLTPGMQEEIIARTLQAA